MTPFCTGKTISDTHFERVVELSIAFKLSTAGRLGGISKFVLQKFPISTNKLKQCNCIFSIEC